MLVTMPTTHDTTNVIDRLHTQKRQERIASRSSRPPVCSLVAGSCVELWLTLVVGNNQRKAKGNASSTGNTPSARNPACQFHRLIAQAVISGSMMAASPEPLRMIASARPRFSSNHKFTRCDQVTCNVPSPASGTRKKPR
ncbi:hypothetical protein D9M71_595610 [compost metagenome]